MSRGTRCLFCVFVWSQMFHISWNGDRLFAVRVLKGNLSEGVSVQRGLLFKFEMKVYIWVWGTCGAVFFSLSSTQTLRFCVSSEDEWKKKWTTTCCRTKQPPLVSRQFIYFVCDVKESLIEGVLNYLLWILLLKVFFLILNKTDTF